jgi:hypothetical protein
VSSLFYKSRPPLPVCQIKGLYCCILSASHDKLNYSTYRVEKCLSNVRTFADLFNRGYTSTLPFQKYFEYKRANFIIYQMGAYSSRFFAALEGNMPERYAWLKSFFFLILVIVLVACSGNPNPPATEQPSATPEANLQESSTPGGVMVLAPEPVEATATPEESIEQPTTLPGTEQAGEYQPTESQPGSDQAGANQPTESPADNNQPATDLSTVTVTVAAPPPVKSTAVDKYQYLSQDVQDGIKVRPGASITINWLVKNVGPTAWSTNYVIRFFTGPQPGGPTSYKFPKVVKPGEAVKLTVTIVAPKTTGDYDSWWKLTNEANQNFGDVDLKFTVSNNPSSPAIQPAASATPG